ncbi:hypothetical protein PXH59_06380 [Xenorhabdus sp. SF857]|uniref:phage baseplate protein n=1 Tax=Xenorhabdus bakwenae TaxID=3026967 RepID=UPI002557E69B|nr:hypothetical protein [Xenorhabdus sp. SF857]WFQ80739.1 hypothetical protein PXH59_06380 [Xenorhabdus sp. SF857]
MENADKALAELINKALSGIDGMIGFGKDQLPTVIEQLMLWQLWANGLLFILFLALTLLVGYIWKRATESYIYNEGCVYMVLFVVVGALGFTSLRCVFTVIKISKSSGGTLERGAFLSQLEILAKSTLKFHVVTPEFVYTNAAIVGYDIAREAKDGATLLKVNLHLEEIREVTVLYDKEQVKNPDDAKKKDTGDKTQKVESNASSGSLEKMVNDLGDLYDDENKSWLVKGKEGAGILWEGFKGIGKDLSDIKSQAENMVNQISNGSF